MALAALLYALLLLAFWFVAGHFSVAARIDGHMPSAFISFALLIAPYWLFGFGAAEVLQKKLIGSAIRVLAPGLLVVLLIGLPPRSTLLPYACVDRIAPDG